MSTWRFLYHLLRYRTWMYGLAGLALIGLEGLNIAAPLIMRAFFDALTGHAQVRIGLWALITLLVAVLLAQLVSYYVLAWSGITYDHTVYALVRGNLFKRILQRPGARAVPSSPARLSAAWKATSRRSAVFCGPPTICSARLCSPSPPSRSCSTSMPALLCW